MASVWAARQPGKHGFEKLVAIKTILPQFASDARYKTMFLDEARLASKIQHANVTQILDLGEEKGVLYLAMEYVEGESLARLALECEKDGEKVPAGILARVAADTCSGLHVAHELVHAGRSLEIVHRDVSPQNILVSLHGDAKIIDFGVAKARGRLAATTNAGLLKGKIQYMPPEQALEGPVDRRADVWAVGAVLYRCLVGRPPYEGENALGTLKQLSSKRPPLPLPAAVHPAMGAVVRKALAYEPGERYQTAAEMRDALEGATIEAGTPTTHADVARFVMTHVGAELATRRGAIERALADAAARGPLPEPPPRPPPPPVPARAHAAMPATPPEPVPSTVPEPSFPAPISLMYPASPPRAAPPETMTQELHSEDLKTLGRCPTHDLALAEDGKCVRCRRAEEAAAEVATPPPPNAKVLAWLFAAIVGTLAIGAFLVAAFWPSSGTEASPAAPAASASVHLPLPSGPSTQGLAALEPAVIDAGHAARGAASDPQAALARAIALEKIVMYSRPSDPDCGALRNWMLAHGHLFLEKDVDADGEARAAWERVARTVPALDIDGTVVVGFEPARIEAAIEYAGARRVEQRR